MGFRSMFVTEGHYDEFPRWFVDKYEHNVNFYEGNTLPLSSKFEAKEYGHWQDLVKDIQRALAPKYPDGRNPLVLVWLHECRGITRVEISNDQIVYMTPYEWRRTDGVDHDYCYGCSDFEGKHVRCELD